jgi:hypothetical protein
MGAAALALCLAACGPADTSSIRGAIVAGLVAGHDGPSPTQASMFRADIRAGWAIAYDPADPPGCEPGGLWDAPEGSAVPANPCTCWVMVRRKNQWIVSSHGLPGTFAPSQESPKDLGDPDRLVYLSPGD